MTTRRQFLNRAGASTVLGMNLTRPAFGDIIDPGTNDSKSLVCLFFNGGMDTYNLLIPRDAARNAIYRQVRGDIAENTTLALETDPISGEEYAIHKKAVGLGQMFNGTDNFSGGQRLSFVGNMGTLIKPLTLAEFQSPGPETRIPRSLASHFDQYRQWQTSRPGDTGASNTLTGWAGRLSDLFEQCYPGNEILNVSFDGNNILQRGLSSNPFAIGRQGLANTGLSGPDFDYSQPGITQTGVQFLRGNVHRRVLENSHRNYLESTYRQISRDAIEDQRALRGSLDFFANSGATLTNMPGTPLGKKLSDVIKIIYARQNQPGGSGALRRQTFFIDSTGWDMHSGLDAFDGKIEDVSKAIAAFQHNLALLGLEDGVIGFSASDFARTLRSNGRGSDHAWGGPQFVFGKPIEGGRVFGPFADQAPGSPDDIGAGGRMIPYHSTDEYYAELLHWFGVTDLDSKKIVLPNYENFLGVSGRTELKFLA